MSSNIKGLLERRDFKIFLGSFYLSVCRDYTYHSDGLYHSMMRAGWDSLHSTLQCCGTLSPDDWADMDQAVPSSCPSQADSEGCVLKFSSWLAANSVLVSLLGAGLMALQVLGVCLACCLARAVQVHHLAI